LFAKGLPAAVQNLSEGCYFPPAIYMSHSIHFSAIAKSYWKTSGENCKRPASSAYKGVPFEQSHFRFLKNSKKQLKNNKKTKPAVRLLNVLYPKCL
jgi:hypothetical protein